MKRVVMYKEGEPKDKKKQEKKDAKRKKKIARAIKKSGDDGSISPKKLGMKRTKMKRPDGTKVKVWTAK